MNSMVFDRRDFESHRGELQALFVGTLRKDVHALLAKRNRKFFLLEVCWGESERAEPLADVLQTTWGPVVGTVNPRTRRYRDVQPLTGDDAQEFTLQRIHGLLFKPLSAGWIRARIAKGDNKIPLKNRARHPILNPGALTPKERRDYLHDILQSLKNSDDPLHDVLMDYTRRELRRATEQLARSRRDTDNSTA